MNYNSKLIGKYYSTIFEKKVINNGMTFDEVVENIREEIGEEFSEYDIIKGILGYYLEKNVNPMDIFIDDDIFYYFRDDLPPVLNEIGFHDKFNVFEGCDYYDIYFDPKGDIFLSVDSWEDFKELFRKDEQYTIENVTSEDWFEMFNFSYIDINEFIDDIDVKSLLVIKEHIIDNYLGHELDEGGVITVEMLNDEDTLKDMIRNESSLEDLKHDLERFYGDAYNVTAEGELFENFLNELKDFFGVSDISWDDRNQLKIKITSTYKNYSLDYLDEFLYLPCEDHSRFLDVISQLLNDTYNKLSLGVNLDYYYPDGNKVDKNLNEIIVDNLY